jgi:hypothetical protein
VKESGGGADTRGREARASRRGARAYPLPPKPRESRLMPQDFDRALRRMKTDLALTELKRQLLDPSLDARSVLELVAQIEGLQRDA